MLPTEVPSASGRWFWWMPTKLPLFMRNINITLLTEWSNFHAGQTKFQAYPGLIWALLNVSLKLLSSDVIDLKIDIGKDQPRKQHITAGNLWKDSIITHVLFSPPASHQLCQYKQLHLQPGQRHFLLGEPHRVISKSPQPYVIWPTYVVVH